MVAKDDAALKDIFKAGNDESLDIFVMVLPLSCMKWENDGKMQSHFLHIKAYLKKSPLNYFNVAYVAFHITERSAKFSSLINFFVRC